VIYDVCFHILEIAQGEQDVGRKVDGSGRGTNKENEGKLEFSPLSLRAEVYFVTKIRM
jgi:hypothetical protein